MAQPVIQSSLGSASADLCKNSAKASTIFGCQLRSPEMERTTQLKFLDYYVRRNPTVQLKASKESSSLTHEILDDKSPKAGLTELKSDYFTEMRNRFLRFKNDKYLRNLEYYRRLSEDQAPEFMVIACADSRVCPTTVLGFQPGEAFVIRNVANLVPPHEYGVSETNAALEFAVNTLEVKNILIVGHSCCGGIRALMSLQKNEIISSSFTKSWVVVGKQAKLKTETAASNLNFDQQCRHCEKESINRSLLNLLTYPWIEDRVLKGTLSLHGGYYNFIDCTLEKWSLDYEKISSMSDGRCYIKAREFWN